MDALAIVGLFREASHFMAGLPRYVTIGAGLMGFFWSAATVRYVTYGGDDVALISGLLGLSCVLSMCLIARWRSSDRSE